MYSTPPRVLTVCMADGLTQSCKVFVGAVTIITVSTLQSGSYITLIALYPCSLQLS